MPIQEQSVQLFCGSLLPPCACVILAMAGSKLWWWRRSRPLVKLTTTRTSWTPPGSTTATLTQRCCRPSPAI
ncbi:unnamed protein product [Symbiodinium natans]|uniref:Uncharacterized protein n=1 Tax=Symbiodinium natans TaxID=878477 RepID=A0A812NAV4_9DINO|nr:unnamed protein product [Symbiodinium natans]